MSIYAYPDVIRNLRVLFEEAMRQGEELNETFLFTNSRYCIS